MKQSFAENEEAVCSRILKSIFKFQGVYLFVVFQRCYGGPGLHLCFC